MKNVATTFSGQDAENEFLKRLNYMFDEHSTGKVYVVRRDANVTLQITAQAHCAIEGLVLDAETDITLLNQYNMVIIDTGNNKGDCWKAIFHPAQKILNIIDESVL